MHQELKGPFVTALRSGEYPQTYGALCEGGKFCAGGVLCELAVEAGVATRSVLTSGTVQYTADGERSVAFVPDGVLKWAGMPAYQMRMLMDMNDQERASFEVIADVVEGWVV
jgi:hypothetical protein